LELVRLPLILGPLITFAVLIYRQMQTDTSSQAFAQLKSLADLKKDQVHNWATVRVSDIANVAGAPDLQTQLRDYFGGLSDGWPVVNHLNTFLINNSEFEAVMVARPTDGVVLLSTRQGRFDRFIGTTFLDPTQLGRAGQAAFIAPASYDPRVQEVLVVVAAPVIDPHFGNTLGLIFGFVRSSQISDVIAPVPGLGQTGHAFVVTHDGYRLGRMVVGSAANSPGIEQARMSNLDGNGV
jgi:hypothetical protein